MFPTVHVVTAPECLFVKTEKPYSNSLWTALLIHGFGPVKTWLLIECDTAFDAIILLKMSIAMRKGKRALYDYWWVIIQMCLSAQPLIGANDMSRLMIKPAKWHVQMPRLIWVFAVSMKKRLDPQLPIEHTAKALIRLGSCPGWSESSLGTRHFVGFVVRQLICLFVWSFL